jgi:hypothetical protein
MAALSRAASNAKVLSLALLQRIHALDRFPAFVEPGYRIGRARFVRPDLLTQMRFLGAVVRVIVSSHLACRPARLARTATKMMRPFTTCWK